MSGARTLEDDDRCGQLATTVTPENVSRVESLIKKDPKIACTEIQDIMKISLGSLTRILHDCLGARKCWVYQYDLETKQQSEVWVFPDEYPPVKFKRNRSASKQMIAYFSANFGHVATIPLGYRKTVTADWYVNHCLPKIFQVWCKRRPQTGVRGLLLHHDNASAHTAAVTLDFLAAIDAQLVQHGHPTTIFT